MPNHGGDYVVPFVTDNDVATAAEMIETFGRSASGEAAARAGRSRDWAITSISAAGGRSSG